MEEERESEWYELQVIMTSYYFYNLTHLVNESKYAQHLHLHHSSPATQEGGVAERKSGGQVDCLHCLTRTRYNPWNKCAQSFKKKILGRGPGFSRQEDRGELRTGSGGGGGVAYARQEVGLHEQCCGSGRLFTGSGSDLEVRIRIRNKKNWFILKRKIFILSYTFYWEFVC